MCPPVQAGRTRRRNPSDMSLEAKHAQPFIPIPDIHVKIDNSVTLNNSLNSKIHPTCQ